MENNTSLPVYSLTSCNFSYADKPILRDIELQLERGKLYGLIGPNGSGKTTLIRLLTGTVNPSSGSVHLNSKDIRTYKKLALAKHLSYVPQSFALGFDFTVEEVVMMGRHPYIDRFGSPQEIDYQLVAHALDELDISHFKKRYVTQLSGGECQRVLVARALAQNTDIMILDEATANLDVRHSIDIMRALKGRVEQDHTTVVTAIHDLDLAAAFCDQLIILSEGELYAQGPVHDLVTEDMLSAIFRVDADIIPPEENGPHIRYRYSHG